MLFSLGENDQVREGGGRRHRQGLGFGVEGFGVWSIPGSCSQSSFKKDLQFRVWGLVCGVWGLACQAFLNISVAVELRKACETQGPVELYALFGFRGFGDCSLKQGGGGEWIVLVMIKAPVRASSRVPCRWQARVSRVPMVYRSLLLVSRD